MYHREVTAQNKINILQSEIYKAEKINKQKKTDDCCFIFL